MTIFVSRLKKKLHGNERIQKNVPGGPKDIHVPNWSEGYIVGNLTT